jgi:hypothetical protein
MEVGAGVGVGVAAEAYRWGHTGNATCTGAEVHEGEAYRGRRT